MVCAFSAIILKAKISPPMSESACSDDVVIVIIVSQ